MGKRTWTEEQINFLKENYSKLLLKEMAMRLGKSEKAIDSARRRFGIKAKDKSQYMHELWEHGKHPMQRPDVLKKFYGDLNPSCRPEVKQKISEIRKREYREHRNQCGWQGPQRQPTVAERLLMGFLRPYGFEWNKSIRTGLNSKLGYANHYKLDISNCHVKLCVEIDGLSHRNREFRDMRKDTFLKSNGWIVMRFDNDYVINNTKKVADMVLTTSTELTKQVKHI